MALGAKALHLAVEDVLLPHRQRLADVVLVEKGDLCRTEVTGDAALADGEPLPDAGGGGRSRHQGGDADGNPLGGLADVIDLPPVLVVPGEVLQQIAGGVQPQLGKSLGPGRADAGKLHQWCMQIHILSPSPEIFFWNYDSTRPAGPP